MNATDTNIETYRACYWRSPDGQREVCLTLPEHSDLSDEELVETAIAEALETELYCTADDLVVGDWSEG